MDNQDLLRDALSQELDALYKNIMLLTTASSLPETDLQLLRGLVSVSQFAAQQMSQQQISGGKLSADVNELRLKVAQLQHENQSYIQQLQWLKNRMALSGKATGETQRRATLKQTLDVAISISQASRGSIFLIDATKKLLGCVFSPADTTERERLSLVDAAIKKGLAGWVIEHRKLEIIADVRLDSRWIGMPHQLDTVRSVLCVPVMHGNHIFGAITVTHPEPRYFTPAAAEMVSALANQMGLVLVTERMQSSHQVTQQQLRYHQDFCKKLLEADLSSAVLIQDNRFLYANQPAADLFGMQSRDLHRLPSIASVIAYEDRDRVMDTLKQCYAGRIRLVNVSFGINQEGGQVIPISAQGIVSNLHENRPAVLLLLHRSS